MLYLPLPLSPSPFLLKVLPSPLNLVPIFIEIDYRPPSATPEFTKIHIASQNDFEIHIQMQVPENSMRALENPM